MSVFTAVINTKKQRKFNITPYEENCVSQLTKIKFKIWRITFLKSFLPLKHFGKDLGGQTDEKVYVFYVKSTILID